MQVTFKPDLARSLKRAHGADEAARRFVQDMQANGTPATPDGAKYTFNNVRAAMRGL